MLFTTEPCESEPVRRRTTPVADDDEGLAPQMAWYLTAKVVFEYVVALVLFILTLPLVLLLAAVVKLTSRGPAFYSQTRLGKNGLPYTIHKLRTMVDNSELLSGPKWATPHDPRITRLGRFLRQTHLDELPQLWNVLCGEMSLVGPRPERPEFVPYLERSIPHYRERLRIRPGVSGLAQVQIPPDTNLASVRRKLAYDLYYIRQLNPWLDLTLILCTGLSLVGVPFRLSCRLFRVPGGEPVEKAYYALCVRTETPSRVTLSPAMPSSLG
jgi:lipopolysaccharide/colanic/teichoic acid biosynthesis glycosyltransferase